MGAYGLRADLEVITTAVESIESCTSADFKLEIGHAGFFKELCKKLNVSDEVVSSIYDCVESRNFVTLNNILDKIGKNDVTDCIRNLPRFFGGAEVIEKAKQIDLGEEGQKSLDYLKELYILLCEAGLEDKIVIDLSLVNRTNYYTGIIFAGYTFGSGEAIVKGGRYDKLLTYFGKDSASIGFAIVVDQLMAALQRQKIEITLTYQTLLFVYHEEHRIEAIREAAEKRNAGQQVELIVWDDSKTQDDYTEYANRNHIAEVRFL